MPGPQPPRPYRVKLNVETISAGSLLWRTVQKDFADSHFREDIRDVDGNGLRGGRFDPAADCRYRYSYVALDPLTALAETLLRNTPYSAAGRLVRRVRLNRQMMVVLEATRPLTFVRLVDAADLAAARTDTWLVQAEPPDYPATRRWAHWFRECAARADGIVWPSKRHPGGQVAVLFGDDDRCGKAVKTSPFASRPLDDADGRSWLAGLLAPLATYLEPVEE
jgi:hypothetical protein